MKKKLGIIGMVDIGKTTLTATKLNLNPVIKCPMCGEYGEKELDNRYYCNNCERDY